MKFSIGDKVVVSHPDHDRFGRTGRVRRLPRQVGGGYYEVDIDGNDPWTIWKDWLAPADAVTRLGLVNPPRIEPARDAGARG